MIGKLVKYNSKYIDSAGSWAKIYIGLVIKEYKGIFKVQWLNTKEKGTTYNSKSDIIIITKGNENE